jgi:predicted acylesterase/phospholipase RssA
MYKNLVLSGGALKGFAFIGILQYLEDDQRTKYIKNVIGSSAGSIIGFLYCLGYTPKQILKLCSDLLKLYVAKEIDINLIFNINETLGIDNGTIITEFLKQCVFDKWGKYDINFLDFSKLTGKNFVVCASNLTTRKPVYFCLDETPDVNVIEAIRASMTLPFIFTPIKIKNEILVDAGIFNNFPIDYLQNFNLKDTIGVVIRSKPFLPTSLNIISFTRLLIDTMLDRLNVKDDELLSKVELIEIDMSNEDVFEFNLDTLKLDVDFNKINRYFHKGYNSIQSKFKSKEESENSENNNNNESSKNSETQLKCKQCIKNKRVKNIYKDDKWVSYQPLLPHYSQEYNIMLLNMFNLD